jgi:hypothetical protein
MCFKFVYFVVYMLYFSKKVKQTCCYLTRIQAYILDCSADLLYNPLFQKCFY